MQKNKNGSQIKPHTHNNFKFRKKIDDQQEIIKAAYPAIKNVVHSDMKTRPIKWM